MVSQSTPLSLRRANTSLKDCRRSRASLERRSRWEKARSAAQIYHYNYRYSLLWTETLTITAPYRYFSIPRCDAFPSNL
eukprot:scaffold277_cov261-Pinguiococcus_pyrenoidosus.AAC.20